MNCHGNRSVSGRMKKFLARIPAKSTKSVESSYPEDMQAYVYSLDNEIVGHREWSQDGVLLHEYGCKNGCRDGWELIYHRNGKLMAAIPWSNGKLVGIGKQWSTDGRLIVEYDLENGTGVELICSAFVGCEDGEYLSVTSGEPVLSIERHWRDGYLNGAERWWDGDNKHISLERFFLDDTPHGIWREWNRKRRLRRGFPQYYVHGERMTKRTYGSRAGKIETLIPFRTEDNDPRRSLPPEFATQLRKRSNGD